MKEADPHPGQVLLDAGVFPMAPGAYLAHRVIPSKGDTINTAAERIGVNKSFLELFVEDVRNIHEVSDGFVESLAKYSGNTVDFWVNLEDAWGYAKRIIPPERRGSYLRVSLGDDNR